MFALARYSYRNLRVRRLTTVLTAGGMGLVVFVFASVLMLAEGLQKTLVSTGSRDNVVFIRRSSEAEVQSILPREQAAVLENLPEIGMDAGGKRLSAREVVILIGLKKLESATVANVLLRGVEAGASFDLRPQIHLAEGRPFNPGSTEIVIGRSIARRFVLHSLGQTIDFGARTWTVVGIMDAGGTGFDSEIWADVDLLMSTFRRPVYSSILARLQAPSDFTRMKERVLADPRLTVDTFRESEYYAAQSELMAKFIRILGLSLTLIFSVGAVIGSMVTMYAAVANRITEIGTLRALGFHRRSILAAFLLESFFLSILGGCLGLSAASTMNRLTISTMNWQTFSELSFSFTLTHRIVVSAFSFAVCMGLAGGLLPAFRAARMDLVAALRPK